MFIMGRTKGIHRATILMKSQRLYGGQRIHGLTRRIHIMIIIERTKNFHMATNPIRNPRTTRGRIVHALQEKNDKIDATYEDEAAFLVADVLKPRQM